MGTPNSLSVEHRDMSESLSLETELSKLYSILAFPLSSRVDVSWDPLVKSKSSWDTVVLLFGQLVHCTWLSLDCRKYAQWLLACSNVRVMLGCFGCWWSGCIPWCRLIEYDILTYANHPSRRVEAFVLFLFKYPIRMHLYNFRLSFCRFFVSDANIWNASKHLYMW
jgi:hypothetical protein